MSLDLNPEVESQVLERARAAGTTASEYIAGLLRRVTPTPVASLPATPGKSDAEKRAGVLAYLTRSKEEIARRNAPSIALLQAQIEEAEHATPEEIAEADAEWETFKRAMNDTRRATGERPLYLENARQ
jgi:hypothetical protein